MPISFTAAITAIIAALAVVFLIGFAVPKPCRAEQTIQAAQKLAGCGAPRQLFHAIRGGN